MGYWPPHPKQKYLHPQKNKNKNGNPPVLKLFNSSSPKTF